MVPLRAAPANKEPSERDLVVRLLELIDSREAIELKCSVALAAVSDAETSLVSTEKEIVSIKRVLGASVRGRRGSHPTRAASSTGSPRARVRGRVESLMADGEPRTTSEVLTQLRITDNLEMQAVRSLIRENWQKKKYARQPTNAGHPPYAYRSKS